MRTFAVYQSPQDECEAVKIGYSWPALVFGPLWAFARQLWIRGLILLFLDVFCLGGVGILAALIGLYISEPLHRGDWVGPVALILFVSYRIIVGRLANGWRRSHLQQRSYKLLNEAVIAKTGEEAITTAKPELVQEHGLLKRALKMVADGNIDDAEVTFERLIREYPDNANVVKRANEELARIRRKTA
jgi:hypothetical protein